MSGVAMVEHHHDSTESDRESLQQYRLEPMATLFHRKETPNDRGLMRWQGLCDFLPPPFDALKAAAEGIASTLAQARDCAELDRIFAKRIDGLGLKSAGYVRVFGKGQFHGAKY